MFSSTEYNYIKDMVLTQYSANNTYYLCYTENSNNNTYNNYDIACYFSEEPIIKNSDYSFTIPNDTLKIELDSGSYSQYNDISKIKKATLNTQNIEVPTYEYIYSNLGTSADIISDVIYNQNNNIAFKIDTHYTFLILVLLILPVVTEFTRHIFYLNKEK